jgi:hypothetical protein
LIACDTRREIKTVESTVSSRNRCGKFWIFKVLCECSSVGIERTAENIESDAHAMQHSSNRRKEVAKPTDHGGYPIVKQESLKRKRK